MKKKIKRLLCSIVIIILIIVLGYRYWETKITIYPACIVLPDGYEGYVLIIETKENYDLPYSKALENFGVLEYHVGNDGILQVESIRHFKVWPNISMGFEWVAPIIYYKESKLKNQYVYGNLIKHSKKEYWFWTGKHKDLKYAYQKTPKFKY